MTQGKLIRPRAPRRIAFATSFLSLDGCSATRSGIAAFERLAKRALNRQLSIAARCSSVALAAATVFLASRAQAQTCDGQPACPATLADMTLASTPNGATVVRSIRLYAQDTATCYYVGSKYNYPGDNPNPPAYYTTTSRAPCPCVASCTQDCIDTAYWRIMAHAQETPWVGTPSDGSWWTSRNCGGVRYFTRGAVYYSPTTGAHTEYDGMYATYYNQGEEFSWLGYPTADQVVANWGSYNVFENGYIFYGPSYGFYTAHAWMDGRYLFNPEIPAAFAPQDQDIPASGGNGAEALTAYQYAVEAINRGAINSTRGRVLEVGLRQAVEAWNGSHYGWGTELWCTEWAAWVYKYSQVYMGIPIFASLWDCTGIDCMVYGFWVNGRLQDVNDSNLEPGDWLSIGGHHSAIVVAVSPDRRWVWTMEGSDNNAVRFVKRDYVVNGQINPRLQDVGKIPI